MSTATLTIDLDALVANWRALDALTTGETAGVVKADAYGLGMARVARAVPTTSRLSLSGRLMAGTTFTVVGGRCGAASLSPSLSHHQPTAAITAITARPAITRNIILLQAHRHPGAC